jgi:phage repressor protein C with HTH and peptisase S24 domain
MDLNDMEAVGKRIKAARESFRGVGMQQRDLTRKLGYKSQSRLSYYELGKRRVPTSELNAIASALEVSSTYLLTGAESPVIPAQILTRADRQISQSFLVAVPWYKGAMLGDGLEEYFAPDDGEMYEVPSWVVTSEPERHIVLTPAGMSMYPRIEPGSMVVVRLEPNPPPGSLIFAMSPDGARYVKGYILNGKEKRLELHSVNPEFGAITKLDGWVVVGSVVLIKKPYVSPGDANMEWDEGRCLKF